MLEKLKPFQIVVLRIENPNNFSMQIYLFKPYRI